MEIKFEKKYLSELYYSGKCNDKKHRYQPQIVKRYIRCIDLLESALSEDELYKYNSLHYEVLQGEKKGISSIRVRDQYRIEFFVTHLENEILISICNILELSNHYK